MTEGVNVNVALGDKTWSDVKPEINPIILNFIHEHFKFTTMSPVQENAIPQLLSHKDVVVEACTGSGKTLAYIVPVFHMLLEKMKTTNLLPNGIYAIIICPTRELAEQVSAIAELFSNMTNITVQRVIGGHDVKFVGHVAVCTPGRLLDVLNSRAAIGQGVFDVKNLEILILDEADRILDMGFERQVNQILAQIPKQRRTGLFSATQTSHMMDLIRSGLRNPVKVQVKVTMKNSAHQSTPLQLTNYYIICHEEAKLSQLLHMLLYTLSPEQEQLKIIIYFSTCACVDFFHKVLLQLVQARKNANRKLQIVGLHGQMVQKRRTVTYEEFLNGKGVQVLLCTDVAARGLDFPDVNYIVQYDPPVDPNSFVHRVGRTARMGKSGTSILFLSKREDNYVEYLQLKKVPIIQGETFIVDGVEQDKEVEDGEESQDDEEEDQKGKVIENVLPEVLEMVKKDHDLVDKSTSAFASYVRGYKEHQLNYIFKFSNLRWSRLMRAFALVALPDIRELKKNNIQLPAAHIVDVDAIPYKDSQREKARLVRLQKNKKKEAELEEERTQLQEEKKLKEKNLSQKKHDVRKDTDLKSKNKKRVYQQLEMEEIRKEKNLLKMLRSGKITEKQYSEMSGEEDFEKALSVSSRDSQPNKKTKTGSEGFVPSLLQSAEAKKKNKKKT
ncbi:ATP-dependent RNA helicase DDX55 [Acrasis kona]|uniref:ATP-dependent RNA helicase n=1 Tax=Acrasis kona TaxID=1008807 RepID=A0AAW2ZEX1_9EUKA